MTIDVRVARDPEAVAEQAAERVIATLAEALAGGATARFVVAGGSSPLGLYDRLAARPEALDWSRVDFFWGDDRCVEPGGVESNYRAVREALLDPLAIGEHRCFRIQGELEPGASADRYHAEIDSVLATGEWDLVLLGLGADGHTASLFPPRSGTSQPSRWAVATEAPSKPKARVSMTLAALERSRQTLFLVTGASKAEAVKRVFGRDPELHASALNSASRRVTWCLDRAAANRLPSAVQSV